MPERHRVADGAQASKQLMAKVDSKFTLVTLSSMRAREINDYYNQLGEGLGRIVPPQVTSVSRKPLSIAMEEVAASEQDHVSSASTRLRPARPPSAVEGAELAWPTSPALADTGDIAPASSRRHANVP